MHYYTRRSFLYPWALPAELLNLFRLFKKRLKIGDAIGNNEKIHTCYGRHTEFVQATANRKAINGQDKLVAEDAPSLSFSAAIEAASGSSSQYDQVCNDSRRPQILREIR